MPSFNRHNSLQFELLVAALWKAEPDRALGDQLFQDLPVQGEHTAQP
jgi:hypothetical protein